MSDVDLVLRARRVILAEGEGPAAICIRDGRIVAIESFDERVVADSERVVSDHLVLMPGLVDTHVHLQDPGRTWEGFESGTMAAALGGVTTVVDMPLDSLPVTVDVAAFEAKVQAARGRIHVDVGLWGGVTPTSLDQIPGLVDAGVFGFKCFLSDTGIDQFAPLSHADLHNALALVGRSDQVLLVHAEDRDTLESLVRKADSVTSAGPQRDYAAFLRTHPAEVETRAVAQVIEAARATGGRAHIVHVSTAAAAGLINASRAAGVSISGETCPHYLTIDAAGVVDGDTLVKVSPPIQGREDADLLWQHLRDGVLDMVVSDHSPCAMEHKHLDTGDFATAFGGISSLQLSLPLVWTEARSRGFSLVDVARWMAQKPAELAGLRQKGVIAVGCDADFAVLDPDATFVVTPGTLAHRQPATPYDGRCLAGVVTETWLGGTPIDLTRPRGRVLLRGRDRTDTPPADPSVGRN